MRKAKFCAKFLGEHEIKMDCMNLMACDTEPWKPTASVTSRGIDLY